MKKIVKSVLAFIVALLLSWLTSSWLVPLAALERGYTGAYGSEWILIGIVFIGTYWAISELMGYIIKVIKWERRKRTNGRLQGVRYTTR